MDEIDLEELITGLEYLVKYFGQDIIIYALQLFQELTKAFARMVQTKLDSDESAAQLAAGGVLKTMDKLLEIGANTEVFPELEEKVSEVITWGLTPQAWEMQDDIFELILTTVKYPNKISQRSWSYFPDIIESVLGNEKEITEFKKDFPNQTYEGCGYESLSDITNIIYNMIVK